MLEKLTVNNMENFKKLYCDNFKIKSYNKDFFKCYENQNFLVKFLYRKYIKLIKYNNIYIGYIWYENSYDNYVKVWALYIDPKYKEELNINILSFFDNNYLAYEEVEREENDLILKTLGFVKKGYTILLSMNTKDFDYKTNNYISNYNREKLIPKLSSNKIDFSFRKFIKGKDEKLRCELQNDIFNKWNRMPLNVGDIYADMAQDYYMDEFSFLGVLNKIPIGYGQIIFNRNMYTIVNFGIISNFRSLGLGRIFLNEIINSAKVNKINDLYIRVDSDNIAAINLYKSIGFKEETKVILWERN